VGGGGGGEQSLGT
jgi:hypothetical protein